MEAKMQKNESKMTTAPRVAALPYDVEMNILSRLPAKSVGRFSCVSKQWLNLVRDPCFIKLHSKNSIQTPRALRIYMIVEEEDTEEEEDMESYSYRIVFKSSDIYGTQLTSTDEYVVKDKYHLSGYCNGLVCLSSDSNIIIYNPTRKQLRVIDYPLPDIGSDFGYVPTTNECKIVLNFDNSDVDMDSQCVVFTLRDKEPIANGSWKEIRNCLWDFFEFGACVCADGVIYWGCDASYLYEISWIDLTDETFGSHLVPEHIVHKDGFHTVLSPDLIALNGVLCIPRYSVPPSCIDNGSSNEPIWEHTIDIWTLKDRHKGIWTKEYCIQLQAKGHSALLKGYFHLNEQDGEILILSGEDILFYNVKSGSCRRSELNLKLEDEWESLDSSSHWLRFYHDTIFSLGE